MFGELRHESAIQAPAAVVWQLYGGLELGRLVESRLSNLIQKVEVVEGDGGEGTVLNLIFPPGNFNFVIVCKFSGKMLEIFWENA